MILINYSEMNFALKDFGFKFQDLKGNWKHLKYPKVSFVQ